MVTKKMGRRRKVDGPAFPADEVERLLVDGEIVRDDETGRQVVHFPTFRDLGARFGVAHSVIAEFSKRHNCLTRRKQRRLRAKEMSDAKLLELRADVLAVTRDDTIRMIDRYLSAFEESIHEGRVRIDSPSDFNTLCRLKAFLLGEADSRQEVSNGMPTLEELQARHKAMLARIAESTPEMRGEVPMANRRGANGDDAHRAEAADHADGAAVGGDDGHDEGDDDGTDPTERMH